MKESRLKGFLKYAVLGSTVRRAAKVALVVTPILTVFNHAHEIVELNFGYRFFLQTALTFLVPYAVATHSCAMTELKNAELQSRAGAGR